ILMTLLTFWFGCGESMITNEGYFKNKERDRINTYSFKKEVSEQQLKEHALKLMNTSGRITAAYYYPEGSKIPQNISIAKNIYNVNDILDNPRFSSWRYAYMNYYIGKKEFVDCQKMPKNGLCRQLK
ncbi:MAG: hypothetical protein QF743_02825, partial [Candidatus Marinimicrobia bacterium]|nr:hypothetical protein [Candidatus Neomarinimicrobiota bacterium]